MGSHHRAGNSPVQFAIDPTAERGRHRDQNGSALGLKAATVAAATGAIVAGGAQLGAGSAAAHPAEAQSFETSPGNAATHVNQSIAGLPFEVPAGVVPENFEIPEIPKELEAVAPDLEAQAAQAQQWINSLNPIKPTTVQPVSGTLTSSFGPRWGAHHGGLDVAAPIGTPVLAAADGQVIDAGPASGFGQWVRVQHDDGTITIYGHVNDYLVNSGQRVTAGQPIATVGNQGQSTGPHLHFEVHDPSGNKVDPAQWLQTRGVAVTWTDATGDM
ncbi:M23 family metallopeptidase [Rhodococcus sp. NPDC058521]|uniref:M23 family metallopeptidase n=1 Tax=Rhodococcus sp. NPDC058521 TaxID=3346536 RepID=UPI00364CE3FF